MSTRRRTLEAINTLLGAAFFYCLLGVATNARAAEPLSICAEPSKGGTNLYWRANPAVKGGQELFGFMPDLVALIERGIKQPIVLRSDLPFARCMKMVADGEVDFAIGIYRDAQREQIYAFSKPYQVLRPQVFMSRDTAVRIESVEDLKKYRGCGMHGSSYAHYDLKPGELDQGTLNYAALKLKVIANRCDYFVEELEVAAQVDAKGNYFVEPELRHNDIRGARPPGRHFVTAKGGRGAAQLPAINNAIDRLMRSGELQSLWQKHLRLAAARPAAPPSGEGE